MAGQKPAKFISETINQNTPPARVLRVRGPFLLGKMAHESIFLQPPQILRSQSSGSDQLNTFPSRFRDKQQRKGYVRRIRSDGGDCHFTGVLIGPRHSGIRRQPA